MEDELSGWVRFENTMPENLKVAPVSDRAFRLWLQAICYCSRAQTDGFVPEALITGLSVTANKRTVDELLDADLLVRVEAGYRVHNYLDYNPSRARIGEMRDATRQRVANHRKRDGNSVTGEDETLLLTGYSPARDRSDSSCSGSSSTEKPSGSSRQATKRVDQDEPPASLAPELHDVAAAVLIVLRSVQSERGGDVPTVRGVGLALVRNPNRDYMRVVREVEHWALAGNGCRKPVKDWARTFGTFLDRTPEGGPSRPGGNVVPFTRPPGPSDLLRAMDAEAAAGAIVDAEVIDEEEAS